MCKFHCQNCSDLQVFVPLKRRSPGFFLVVVVFAHAVSNGFSMGLTFNHHEILTSKLVTLEHFTQAVAGCTPRNEGRVAW